MYTYFLIFGYGVLGFIIAWFTQSSRNYRAQETQSKVFQTKEREIWSDGFSKGWDACWETRKPLNKNSPWMNDPNQE